MLKNQCAWDASISLHLSLWLIFSKAMRALSFPQRWQKGEEVHKLIYLSLSIVLRTSGWRVPAPPQSSAGLEQKLHPLLKAHRVALRMTVTYSFSAFQHSCSTGSGASVPGSLLSELSTERGESLLSSSGRVLDGIGAMLESFILGTNERQALQVTVIANPSTVDGSNLYSQYVS